MKGWRRGDAKGRKTHRGSRPTSPATAAIRAQVVRMEARLAAFGSLAPGLSADDLSARERVVDQLAWARRCAEAGNHHLPAIWNAEHLAQKIGDAEARTEALELCRGARAAWGYPLKDPVYFEPQEPLNFAPEPPRAAALPKEKPSKGDPLAAELGKLAPELVQMLHDAWPNLNAANMPDGGYAMARGVVAEVVYGELAAVRGMRVAPIELGTVDGMASACAILRARVRRLPLDQVTPDLFGCIHEALCGYHLERGKVVPNDGRRKGGVHYTPPELAMKVTTRTVEPLLACIGAQSPLVLRVCDPAVGAGAFLLALMRMLAPIVLERGEASNLDEAKRLVAMHCCYGVDKSRYAVHSCALAITLEARADRMPRGWLDDNIKHGDALVGLDREQIVAFNWRRDAAATREIAELYDRATQQAARERLVRLERLSSQARW